MTSRDRDLALIGHLTSEMGRHAEASRALGDLRRDVILRVRHSDQRCTYEDIAAAMGKTTQAVFKAIQGPLFEERVAQLSLPERSS